MARRIHPFAYFVPPKEQERGVRIHQTRDMAALNEVLPALFNLGYERGELILNMPAREPPKTPPRDEDLFKIDLSFVETRDLLVQMTRPPISDQEQGDRKKVVRAYTDVEKALLNAWEDYLCVCSRKRVKLADPLRAVLRQGFQDRNDIEFREKPTALYKKLNALDGKGLQAVERDTRRTAAFLLHLKEAWKGGPGFLSAFGMDGTSTLVWAYRLGRDLSYLLSKPGFTFVEMECDEIPKRPTDLTWVESWTIEIIAEHREVPVGAVHDFPGAPTPPAQEIRPGTRSPRR